MPVFNKVAVVGTGLIGGSLAMALKRKKLARRIVGVSRHEETLRIAKKKSIIDSGSRDLNIVRDADLVILATPVDTILKSGRAIRGLIKDSCIVTDVGSTKQKIVRSLARIFPRFVGSHPLAGSEKRGIINADPRIFKGSVCLLTPVAGTDRSALKKIQRLWESLGARVVFISPERHDKALAFVSHLPHIAAFSLINSVPAEDLKFASGGLRDTTRIAASDPGIWADIFLSNRSNIIKAIGVWQRNAGLLKSAIAHQDRRRIAGILNQAKSKRSKLS